MGKYENIKEIVNRIHAINFDKNSGIIRYDDFDESNPDAFKFDAIQARFKEHAVGYCELCDRSESYAFREDNNDLFKLNNISHGTHSFDFLHAFGLSDEQIFDLIENEKWNDDPVLFLMENPSIGTIDGDYRTYNYTKTYGSEGKLPAANWYWIHGSLKTNYDLGRYYDDTFFIQTEYGNMVAALIKQFKLGNAYLTNTVKCGISDARIENGEFKETKYKNLDEYTRLCKCTCIEHILIKEIEELCRSENGLKPIRIFAFGERPYWIMSDILRNYEKLNIDYKIYQLPHPASREKNTYRKYILKGALEEAFNKGISFEKSNTSKRIVSPGEVEKIFRTVYKDVSLGKRTTKNQCSLNIIKHTSLFSEEEIVSEIFIKGLKNEEIKFNWGIGYVFETNDYWYWDYDKKEYVRKESIPYHNFFEQAITKILEEK